MSMPPLVSVCCIAYNQQRYIEEAIKGFLLQQTSFPVEIVIYDDHSTDSTPSIIQQYAAQYPHLIVPILSTENVFSKGRNPFSLAFAQARGKYIATCEGDDYWTGHDKLQRQADFLESHPECVSCFHYATWRVQATGLVQTTKYGPASTQAAYTIDDILSNYCFIHTAAHMFRREIGTLPPFFDDFFPLFDFPLFVHLATKGPIGFLPVEGLSVYRYNSGGVWAGASPLEKARHGVRTLSLVGQRFGLRDRASFACGISKRKRNLRREIIKAMTQTPSQAERLSFLDMALGHEIDSAVATHEDVKVIDSGLRTKELLAVASLRKELHTELHSALHPDLPWLYRTPSTTDLTVFDIEQATPPLVGALFALTPPAFDAATRLANRATSVVPLIDAFDELDALLHRRTDFAKLAELHVVLAYEGACARFGAPCLPLFGAGKFASWLVTLLTSRSRPLPSVIYDDAPPAFSLHGIEVRPTGQYGPSRPAPFTHPAIVLATDCKQSLFGTRCRVIFPDAEPLDLYNGELCAPLPK